MKVKGWYQRQNRVVRACLCLLLLGVLAFSALEGYVLLHARTWVEGEPEVMVIYGCKVMPWGEPSIALSDRLDAALEYFEAHPDTLVIVTGGQGPDEPVTEAGAMRDYLVEKGVPPEQILTEGASHNTWQNVKNTLELMETLGLETDGNVVAASSGSHLCRVEILWKRAGGGELAGAVAAPISHAPSAVKMFFREPIAMVKSFLLDR